MKEKVIDFADRLKRGKKLYEDEVAENKTKDKKIRKLEKKVKELEETEDDALTKAHAKIAKLENERAQFKLQIEG